MKYPTRSLVRATIISLLDAVMFSLWSPSMHSEMPTHPRMFDRPEETHTSGHWNVLATGITFRFKLPNTCLSSNCRIQTQRSKQLHVKVFLQVVLYRHLSKQIPVSWSCRVVPLISNAFGAGTSLSALLLFSSTIYNCYRDIFYVYTPKPVCHEENKTHKAPTDFLPFIALCILLKMILFTPFIPSR